MGMLFLGSMLMIMIVTDLSWEPVSPRSVPLDYTTAIYLTQIHFAQILFFLANLIQKLSQNVTLGKGLVELLKP